VVQRLDLMGAATVCRLASAAMPKNFMHYGFTGKAEGHSGSV
jgi:hypothetical protein